jgi:hypothetical protein
LFTSESKAFNDSLIHTKDILTHRDATRRVARFSKTRQEKSMSPLEEVGHQEVIWLLGSLSGLYRLPFDAALVSQEFPPPYSIATFSRGGTFAGAENRQCRH